MGYKIVGAFRRDALLTHVRKRSLQAVVFYPDYISHLIKYSGIGNRCNFRGRIIRVHNVPHDLNFH